MIGLLTCGEPRALAQRVADIAEHEEIAERRSCQPDKVVGLAGDQAARKAPGIVRHRIGVIVRRLDLVGERRIEHHAAVLRQLGEALRQIGVIGRKRLLNLGSGNRRIELLRQRAVGKLHRIALRNELPLRIEPARHHRESRHRERHHAAERQRRAAAALARRVMQLLLPHGLNEALLPHGLHAGLCPTAAQSAAAKAGAGP